MQPPAADARCLPLCLGREQSPDLRALLCRHPIDDRPLLEAIDRALLHKPQHHDFSASAEVQVLRSMNASGCWPIL